VFFKVEIRKDNSMTDIFIQIAGISILSMALLQIVHFSISILRSHSYRRRQCKEEMAVLEKQVQVHALRLTLAKTKIDGLWDGYRKFTIAKKQHEKKSGICSFYLKPHDGKSIPTFEPGQYLFFKLNIPSEKKPVLRCYSLSDSPINKDYYRVSIKKALAPRDKPEAPTGKSSSFFHEHLMEGDIVDVRAPAGNFHIDLHSHKPVILLGGGVGLTPVLSMLNALCDLNSKRETWFFLGIRNGGEHIMEDHFNAIKKKFDNIHIYICYSSPTDEDLKAPKYDHQGRINVELLKEVLPSNNYEYYFCGPPPFMTSLENDLQGWGVPKAAIHYEYFGPPAVEKNTAVLAEKIPIVFSRSEKTLDWDGSISVLDLAGDNGINIDHSCKRGMCGLCQTPIKSGAVEYDEEPEYLPELEEGLCLTCVAKPKGSLELDA